MSNLVIVAEVVLGVIFVAVFAAWAREIGERMPPPRWLANDSLATLIALGATILIALAIAMSIAGLIDLGMRALMAMVAVPVAIAIAIPPVGFLWRRARPARPHGPPGARPLAP